MIDRAFPVIGVAQMTSTFSTFSGGKSGTRKKSGTGFWLRREGGAVLFATVKHLVDPQLGRVPGGILKDVEIRLRSVVGGDVVLPESRLFRVTNLEKCLVLSRVADCALFVAPEFESKPSNYRIHPLVSETDLAGEDDLKQFNLLDQVGFIGYPGGDHPWWDTMNHLPVARAGVFASLPSVAFANNLVETGDVALLSGLSFNGTSGSPVVSQQRGLNFPPNSQLKDPSYLPPKIVGLMSGHLDGVPDSQRPEVIRHSGLSYFTRSTAILATIELSRAS